MYLHEIWEVEVKQKLLFCWLMASEVIRHGIFWIIRVSVSLKRQGEWHLFLQWWIQQDLCGSEANSCGGSFLISGLQLRP